MELQAIPTRGIYRFVAFVVLAALAASIAAGYFMFFKHVTVFVGDKQITKITTVETVGEVLLEMGLELREEDYIFPEPEKRLARNMGIVVVRAQPFTVQHDGDATEVWSVGKKVGDILDAAGIRYFMQDIVMPPAESPALSGNPINVVRVQSQLFEEEFIEPFAQKRVPNSNLYRGQERIIQQGRDGKVVNTYEVVYHDGEEVEKTVVDSREIVSRVDKVTEYGTISSISRGGYTIQLRRVVDTLATAYCPGTLGSGCPTTASGGAVCTGRYNNGLTSTGLPAVAGNGSWENPHIIAVDRRLIPLGSRVYLQFPGGKITTSHGTIIRDGFAVAADVGSAIQGNRIDVLFDRHNVALSFGRRSVRVFLVDSVAKE